MNTDYKIIRDLDAYVRVRAKKDTTITLKLKAKIAEMNSDELHIAEVYYHQLLASDIRTLGEIGCIELAVELAAWLYPRILREAYAERSKDYMLAS
jgi:hypothetical protein